MDKSLQNGQVFELCTAERYDLQRSHEKSQTSVPCT